MASQAGWYSGGYQEGQDPRWNAVDQWAFSQTQSSKSIPTTEVLKKAFEHQQASGLPDIAVSPAQGQYLQIQAKLIDAKHILEVGTLGGFSTIFLANASLETKVTTVEVDKHHAKVARKNVDDAGVGDRVEILLGPGLDVLPRLLEEVKEGKRPRWDLVFIDANKDHNWDYFDMAAQMSRPGACLIVDNVVRKGALVDKAKLKDIYVAGSRKVITNAGKDDRFDSTVLQVVGDKGYDGMLVAILKR
jgi:predicted O-methyltransferase YrrM